MTVEAINLKTKIKTVFFDDVIVRVPVEFCDKCEDWQDFAFGSYQRGIAAEKIIWFCGTCK